jgi:hypothetical protein
VQRRLRIGAALVALVCIIGLDGGQAGASRPVTGRVLDAAGEARAPGLQPRIKVNSPWGKDDTTGDARRDQGDLRRIIVENGRQQMTFTFRTVATPLWDNASTDRVTGMVFDMDWQGTTVQPNRTLVVTREDGVWTTAIFRGNGAIECVRPAGGVRQLSNHRFVLSAPVQMCLGGAHVLRVASGFVDDGDDGPAQDTSIDAAPNSRFYGPFIRLPGSSRAGGRDVTAGWVHA